MGTRQPTFWIDAQHSVAVCEGWTDEFRDQLIAARICNLQIRGWDRQDLDPVLALKDQLEILHVERDVPDLSAVAHLSKLQRLSVSSGLESVDWACVAGLEELTVAGDQLRLGNLDRCVSLRTLAICNGGLGTLEPLAGLSRLTGLQVAEAPLASLRGIEGLRALERLRLQEVPLATLDGLEQLERLADLSLVRTGLTDIGLVARLPALHALTVGACRKLRGLDVIGAVRGLDRLAIQQQPLRATAFLAALTGLRVLSLDDVGAVPSLAFLEPLGQLEVFAGRDGTRIVDGDLSVLLKLPQLRMIELDDRPSYRPRPEDIMRVLLGRRTWGAGSFENEAAVRWTRSLRTTGPDPYGDVMRTLMAVSGAQEVRAKLGQEAVAAADVVARAYGRWGVRSEHSAAADAWVEANRGEGAEGLHWHALAALHRVVSEPSSLPRLWQERGATEWLTAIDELRGRLSSERG